jgi:hypothetical protein
MRPEEDHMRPTARSPLPDTTAIRQRADHLLGLARMIENASSRYLDGAEVDGAPTVLAGRLLRRNVVQLEVAVVDLRGTARRLIRHADDIERSAGTAGVAGDRTPAMR